jgi:hypothetical protein
LRKLTHIAANNVGRAGDRLSVLVVWQMLSGNFGSGLGFI